MAEPQVTPVTPAPTQSSSQRGTSNSNRRGRSGRGRGRGAHNRALAHGSGGPPRSSGNADPATAQNPSMPAEERPSSSVEPRIATSRGRGDRRGGRRGGRGGQAGQGTQIAPRRAFGGHLSSAVDQEAATSLSADAPSFVPGQPISQRERRPPKSKPQDAPKPLPRRASKSEAPDLTTRIHEDIDNGQYECVICSSEVVRTSPVTRFAEIYYPVESISAVKLVILVFAGLAVSQCFRPATVLQADSTGEPDDPTGTWYEGSFACEQGCGRKYDCDFHTNTSVSNSAIEEVATPASRQYLRKLAVLAVAHGSILLSHVVRSLLNVEHQCHPDDVDCPKCPFLVEKRCICGKEILKNQPFCTHVKIFAIEKKRNRQLAEALNVDPDHTDDHIPYQAVTLKLFRDNTQWGQTQEREFRVFAESNLRNMRFKPMKSYQRQFLHALAEDFGLDSESQDPEPHRHVSIFKGPRFVSAPKKTLMQCVRIAKAAAPARAEAPTKPAQQPYNALLLSRPKFGLTIEELDSALAADLASAVPAEHKNNLAFATSFLPTDEVLIKATTKTIAATIASGTLTPAQVESLLATLKPKVAKAIAAGGLAGGVVLCTADATSLHVLRREGDGSGGNGGGWSQVASRGAARPRQWAAAPVIDAKVPGTGFVALRRLGARKQDSKGEVPAEE
ncbi:nf-x1-type zinc finger protein nfxl1 [Diaporthe amygdali]|uniref:nf-x1-type zinc finger protein nfxl1 n=1 Tax=Phomopsis amygdali TaxID=1214568 RepID=UPI0022FE1032|nr:nf-x1-type zinc finger protein nfxl1 [Diaporthe amygdali]KAJ0121127.1 nf-x1-type zinc finger protein nfxl1 [Diaporthe amygdali]